MTSIITDENSENNRQRAITLLVQHHKKLKPANRTARALIHALGFHSFPGVLYIPTKAVYYPALTGGFSRPFLYVNIMSSEHCGFGPASGRELWWSTRALHADDHLESNQAVAPPLHVSTTFTYEPNPHLLKSGVNAEMSDDFLGTHPRQLKALLCFHSPFINEMNRL